MKRQLLFIIITFLISGTVKSQRNVSFVEEYIDFEINQNHFSINGIYTFCNNGEKEAKQNILFPFAEKTALIDSIRVTNLKSLEKVNFKKLESAISFEFLIQPNDTVDINIFYRQKPCKINKYIITTTKAWEKSLEKAVYTLTVPLDIKIESFSYFPDSQEEINGKILYLWEKFNFEPDIDFEFVIRD